MCVQSTTLGAMRRNAPQPSSQPCACNPSGWLRATACSQAVSLALARRVGLVSTRLGLVITPLVLALARLRVISKGIVLIISKGIVLVIGIVLIIGIGQHAIQHSFWDELPIWVLFLGVESKTAGVIKESFELKLPPASEGGEGGGGGGDMGWEEFQLPANHRFLLLFNIPHLHSKHESPAEVKHWRKDDVVGAWWRL